MEIAVNALLQTSSHFRPASRLSSIGVSEILKITGLATDLKRQGKDVIILGTGEPDFDTPAHIKDAAARAMYAGSTKYTALDGTPELKSAIRAKFRRDNGLEFAQDEITVSSGAKQVLYNAMMASLDPGDEVIIPAPFWVSYADIVLIAGGKPVLVPCSEANGFRLSAGDLEAAISPRTRWVMLNSPSNPTGAAYGEADYRPLLDVLLRHPHVWLIVDDIYEHIVYDDFRFVTPAAIEPGLQSPHADGQRCVQSLCDDRLAHWLRGRAKRADSSHGYCPEPIDVLRIIGQPGGSCGSPQRSAGHRARPLSVVSGAPRSCRFRIEWDQRYYLPRARRGVLHLRQLCGLGSLL